MHRSTLLMVCCLLAGMNAWAEDELQRSSHPQGMQVHGNADVRATQQQSAPSAVAVGTANTARSTSGSIRGSTSIQGNTRIKAEQSNATAASVGRDNTASNQAGVIGGK